MLSGVYRRKQQKTFKISNSDYLLSLISNMQIEFRKVFDETNMSRKTIKILRIKRNKSMFIVKFSYQSNRANYYPQPSASLSYHQYLLTQLKISHETKRLNLCETFLFFYPPVAEVRMINNRTDLSIQNPYRCRPP